MITTNVDVSAFEELRGKLLNAAQTDALLREIATGMLSVTRTRIHEDGKRADGSSMGNYSPSYLELRKKKGDSNSKVRLFFTGQMQNDYKIVPLSATEYGLGFSNTTNSDKANWSEDRFGKVWALTDSELDQVRDIISEFIQKAFK